MEMAKFQNDFVVMTTTLKPKCFQVVYKAAKRGAKMAIAILETSYEIQVQDTWYSEQVFQEESKY